MKTKRTKGFTLIELLIILSIIGILAAIAIPNFIDYSNRKEAERLGINVCPEGWIDVTIDNSYYGYVNPEVLPEAIRVTKSDDPEMMIIITMCNIEDGRAVKYTRRIFSISTIETGYRIPEPSL